MTIRTFEKSDTAQVISLWQETFNYPTAHNRPLLTIEKKLACQPELFFVATEGTEIIGTVMAGYDGHRGWIYSLAVTPALRRRGIGQALVRHAEAVLAERGCLKVNLQVLPANAGVIAFYQKLGFKVEERISMGKTL